MVKRQVMLFVFAPRLVLIFLGTERTANFFLDYSCTSCFTLSSWLDFLFSWFFLENWGEQTAREKHWAKDTKDTTKEKMKRKWKTLVIIISRAFNSLIMLLLSLFLFCHYFLLVSLAWHGHDWNLDWNPHWLDSLTSFSFDDESCNLKNNITNNLQTSPQDRWTRQVMLAKVENWRSLVLKDQRYNLQERIMDDIQYQYVMITETSTGKLTARLPSLTLSSPTGKHLRKLPSVF